MTKTQMMSKNRPASDRTGVTRPEETAAFLRLEFQLAQA